VPVTNVHLTISGTGEQIGDAP